MTAIVPRLVCAACGWRPGPIEVDPYPFRCPRAGMDDGDHVIQRSISDVGRRAEQAPPLPVADSGLATSDSHGNTRAVAASPKRAGAKAGGTSDDGGLSHNPFIRYRTSLYSWQIFQALADRAGLKPCSAEADRDYCSIVERVDAAIEHVAGCGFRVTPFYRSDRLSSALGFDASGGVWVKDETGNVSGSHKARHLMGVAFYLEVLRRLGVDRGTDRPLAVASCGNAALAAAVVARAIGRKLLVFVPEHAPSPIVAQLEQLGAVVTRCSRATPSSGDPSYLAFRRAVDDGALAFSCQGSENGLVIEGAATIGYEIIDQTNDTVPDATSVGRGFSLAVPDRIFIQVGGGALASACVEAFTDCVVAGRLAALPRIHAVQTRGGYPLKRAYDLVVEHVFERLVQFSPGAHTGFATEGDRAAYMLRAASPALLDEVFAYARTHRSQFMWPWETEPRSIASGILDDETYDWAAVVEGMVRSGGFPVVVDEATLEEANVLASSNVDHTGSAGLAGLIALTRSLDKPRPTERITVLFTGVRRP